VRKIIILFILVLIPSFVSSQDKDYTKYPGYVDLSDIEQFKESESTVEVFITKPLLSLVAAASSDEDPQLYRLLKNLDLIKVDNFSVTEEKTGDLKKIIKKISDRLINDKWSRVVRVRETDERVEIFIKNEGNRVAGLLIMSLEYNNNKEATFVNIVGNIDMESLGKLSRKFDIPRLDSLTTKDKTNK